MLVVGNRIERMPETELAADCMLPKGPPDQFDTMNLLLHTIPHDADYNSEHWTTVDKDNQIPLVGPQQTIGHAHTPTCNSSALGLMHIMNLTNPILVITEPHPII